MLTKQKIPLQKKINRLIFELFIYLILLEVGLRIGGFVFLSVQEYKNRNSIRQKGTYRIMCLGESSTAIGGKVSYPSQLEEILNQRDTGIRFSVINRGLPSINTTIILSKLEGNLNKYTPDMVITMMGINDYADIVAYEDIPTKNTTSFINSFRTYKLVRLLWLHIIDKVRESRIYKPEDMASPDDLTLSSIYNGQERLSSGSIEITLDNYRECIKLGQRYRDQGEYDKAEGMFKKAIQIDPESYMAYVVLGRCYWDQGDYAKAEGMFKKAIQVNPENYRAYAVLGQWYKDKGDYDKAEGMFKKAIQIDPENYMAYVVLGRWHIGQGDYAKAEGMFKKAIQVNPENKWAYAELGQWYRDQGEYDKAEGMFKKYIQIDPENYMAYVVLGRCYLYQGDYDKAEEVLKKAIQIEPENYRAYGTLAHCYKELERYKSAEEYFKKASRLRSEYYHPITRHNYQRLKEILTYRGIKLVCIQYPMRSVEPLKKMLGSNEGIIFVDNEGVFKEALKQASYDEYFVDTVGGDFGHCTHKGNRLLAENIANVILKECFDIK